MTFLIDAAKADWESRIILENLNPKMQFCFSNIDKLRKKKERFSVDKIFGKFAFNRC